MKKRSVSRHLHNEATLKQRELKALEAINTLGKEVGLNPDEITKIEHLIKTNAGELVAHIDNFESALNPKRLAFLALVKYRKSVYKWYTPFKNHRLMKIGQRYADLWSSINPRETAASAIPTLSCVQKN